MKKYIVPDPVSKVKYSCTYHETKIPIYKVKQEILSLDPWIVMFYDVITDKEIRILKRLTLYKVCGRMSFPNRALYL